MARTGIGQSHDRDDLPYRQIHLDFHTSPAIPGIGAKFDAAAFARTMAAANVDSVTVFAKCHHGYLYYDTKRPERHPQLAPDLNLLGEQVDALHARGIRAPIYISLQVDQYAGHTHPEWIVRMPDGETRDGGGPFNAGWYVMDMSSPYQDYLVEQTTEILAKFKPVDGVFFDMCWSQRSATRWAIDGMRARGLDPADGADQRAYADAVALEYMARFRKMVKATSPDARVYYNSRPMAQLPGDVPHLDHIEIEALATGGWGYAFFPKYARYARTFGRPYMGMTARFHRHWGDFGGHKPYAALEYETSQMMAHGARCSIGDQMNPDGTLDALAYADIGRAYQRVKDREPWLRDTKPLVDVGLMLLGAGLPGAREEDGEKLTAAENGAVRLLSQLRGQFNTIDTTSSLDGYRLIVLPDCVRVDAALARRLQAFVKQGGRILATGYSGLTEDGRALTLAMLPITPVGPSPLTTTYFRFRREAGTEIGTPAFRAADHVMYDRGLRVTAAKGAYVLASVVEPYFERAWDHFCSHGQTPPKARASKYAAAVAGDQDRAAYISYPVFSAYARHASPACRTLVAAVLHRLLPEPMLTADGPAGLETSVTRQHVGKSERTIIHLLHYSPQRLAPDLDIVEDIIPLHDVTISLKQTRAPRRVTLEPRGQRLDFDHADGRTRVTVPRVNGHAMVVFE